MAYLLLLVSAVVPLPILFFLAAAAAVTLELVLSRRAPYLLPEALTTGLGVRFRVLSLDVLTALLAARLLPDGGRIVALAIVAVLLLAAGRDAAGVFARRLQWRRAGGPASWRNLDVPGLPVPQPTSPVPVLDLPFTLLGLLIPLGYALGSVTDRFGAAIAAQWVSIAAVVVFLVVRFVQYVVLNRPDAEVREAVRAAIEAHAPEVVLHHAGRRGTVEQVLLWVPTLLALERPCLIVVRENTHLDALAGCGIPVVWAPRSQDVELYMVASVDLALYPTNSTNINNHLLRVPGIYDVLIGHGDSDEPESSSPLARMYDEVWVAGPLGRERYAYPVSGVPASKVKEIGAVRPPAPPIRPGAARPTVVYAPTWENVADATDLSSLLPHGAEIVEALLARQDVRVLVVPAAPTGSRLPAAAVAVERLRARIAAAGGDHAVWAADRLPEALSIAAFAVVDVAPALVETIRADVPYAVPAVKDVGTGSYPTVAAGSVLHDYPHDVFAALDDALGVDAHAEARLALGRRIDSSGDVAGRFRAAVDAGIAVQRRRRAFARPTA
ncbi:hypothetical protein D1781_16830 [Amnibacterium setariae]|uniref:Uncharacterized protein n=1 Tax=Amnibacterium setariae TaxID=2306585 RepID=A0A3A1TU33_9MICO|nr:hypothetical protein D1781_16830 [Amnibacterium setariae]